MQPLTNLMPHKPVRRLRSKLSQRDDFCATITVSPVCYTPILLHLEKLQKALSFALLNLLVHPLNNFCREAQKVIFIQIFVLDLLEPILSIRWLPYQHQRVVMNEITLQQLIRNWECNISNSQI